MQHHPGYLIPANVQPEDFYCLKVYIPKDEIYLYAFSGAYQFFGKWLAWERDAEHRGALAAQAWLNAIDYTFDNGWLNCGDNVCEHCDLIPEILAKLEELGNMNINVSTGCGCGCNCQSQTEPPDENDAEIPPDPDSEPQNPQLQQKCNACNFVAVTLRNSLGYAQASEDYTSFKNYWLQQWNVLPSPPTPPGFGVWTMLKIYTGGWDIPGTWDIVHNNLVCMLFNAANKADALTAVRDWSEVFPAFRDAAVRIAAASIDFDILFVPVTLPPGYTNRQCCGQVPTEPDYEMPTAPTGYAWLPIAPGHLSFDSSSGSPGVVPIETIGNGYIRAGFASGSGGWDTTWDINLSNILNDGRLPSVGVDLVGVGMTFRAATLSGGSLQAYYGFPSYQNDWYFEAAAHVPGATWLLRDTSAPSSLDASFDYANGSSPGGWTQFAVHHQATAGYTEVLAWWLVQL